MIIIKPELVTTTTLISSNVPLSEYPQWVSGTNYALGARVYHQGAGEPYPHDYELVVDGETHTTPPGQQPSYWLNIGASQRFRIFDKVVGNQTFNPNTIDFTVRLGAIVDGIALFGLSGASVRVIMTDPVDGVVYDRTMDLTDLSSIVSYFTYQFEPVGDRRTEIAFLDMPAYAAADVRVIVDAGTGTAAAGEVVMGSQRVIGVSNFGTTIGLRDYSRKEVDQFGNFTIVERRFAKIVDYDVTIETSELARVQRFFAQIRATPVVAIGDPSKEETLAYGFYKDFSVPISTPSICDATIQFEGLT